jgi:hypothetical protein
MMSIVMRVEHNALQAIALLAKSIYAGEMVAQTSLSHDEGESWSACEW